MCFLCLDMQENCRQYEKIALKENIAAIILLICQSDKNLEWTSVNAVESLFFCSFWILHNLHEWRHNAFARRTNVSIKIDSNEKMSEKQGRVSAYAFETWYKTWQTQIICQRHKMNRFLSIYCQALAQYCGWWCNLFERGRIHLHLIWHHCIACIFSTWAQSVRFSQNKIMLFILVDLTVVTFVAAYKVCPTKSNFLARSW